MPSHTSAYVDVYVCVCALCVPLEIFVRQAQRARIIRINFFHAHAYYVRENKLISSLSHLHDFQQMLICVETPNIIAHFECTRFAQNQKE